jgi:DNA-binding LytR/AlgR family response regulator
VEDSVKWFNNHQQPDLIFSDIQLSDGISFEIYDQVKITRPVIFTTAFDEFMLRAFRVNSIDYLLKPIKKEDLQNSINKYHVMRTAFGGSVDLGEVLKGMNLGGDDYKTRFLAKVGDKLVSVETENVAYFQTKHGVVHMCTFQGRVYLMDQTLDELLKSLDPKVFFRANRQFVVHFKSIETIHKYHKGKLLIELKSKADEEVIVSAERAGEFRKWLGD